MTTIDTLTQRNHDFATQRFTAGLPMMPSLRTMIISCVDPRVDPTHLLELEPGEAVVLRNVGGRITPGTLQMMGMLSTLTPAGAQAAGGGMNLIVLHHTDCGITRMAANPPMLAGYFGIAPAELAAKHVMNPHAAVAVDVAALRANPALPGEWQVAGMVYDVATGLVEVAIPSAPLRAVGESM